MNALSLHPRHEPDPVEHAFLHAAEQWREQLARNLALRNPSFPSEDLDVAVQRTIEQIVFLRLCEDRGAEPYGRLLELATGNDICDRLNDSFRSADQKYALGLFRRAAGASAAEEAERRPPVFGLDDDVLSPILASLYDQTSPRALSLLPADILGQLYERFLARVVLGESQRQAKRKRKVAARKAFGVYYTPRAVVDYVVRTTVGRVLGSKTPSEATALRVLDPACGSGSFLLGAYQHLLDWHLAWYVAEGAEKHAAGPRPPLCRDRRGEWQLTIEKRTEILQNGIFGVDLDGPAVEVTKLSLLLKLLDGDVDETAERHPKPFAGGGPPDLGKNIQCGNSLIDADYGELGAQGHTRDSTHPFDWRRRFSSIFAQGGFDIVIGNPPYVSFGGRQGVPISEAHAAYFERHYESAGWATAHSFFMERAAKLLSKRLVSFIVPDQVGHLDGYRSLRRVLLRLGGLVEVKYWGEKVFENVTTPSLTFVLDVENPHEATRIRGSDGSDQVGPIRGDTPWTLSGSKTLLEKLKGQSMSIRPFIADCGIRTTDAKRQVLPIGHPQGRFVPTLEGKQIGRYWCAPPEVTVRLDAGEVFRSKEDKYRRARFLIRQTAAYPIVGPREHATYFRNSLHALYEPGPGLDVRYVVGLLNSKVVRFAYVKMIREARQRTFPQVKLGPLGQLPIRRIDVGLPSDKAAHDRVVRSVEELLRIHRELQVETDEKLIESLRKAGRSVDVSIDAEVYELYGLNQVEIDEVEETVGTVPAPPLAT
jgi:hypothetical protein